MRQPATVRGVFLACFVLVIAGCATDGAGSAASTSSPTSIFEIPSVTLEPVATPIPTPAPISTPTPPPAPTPTPLAATPQPDGEVLYEADWSTGLGGWTGRLDWTTASGMLVNDGTGPHDWRLSALAPYVPVGPDYALEATIEVVAVNGCSSFGLVARQTEGTWGYQGGINFCEFEGAAIWDIGPSWTAFRPGSTRHTYRLEVRGTEIRLFVDGTLMVAATNESIAGPGRVGLWCDQMQVHVATFRVISLG